jgi:hypothetical protein
MSLTLPRSLSLLPSSRTQARRLVHVESVGNGLVSFPFGGGVSASALAATNPNTPIAATVSAPARNANGRRRRPLNFLPFPQFAKAAVAGLPEKSRSSGALALSLDA